MKSSDTMDSTASPNLEHSTSDPKREPGNEDALTRLLGLSQGLARDEVAILLLVAEGLRGGQSVYGPLEVATDQRDFVAETLEEVRDSLVYVGSRLLQLTAQREPTNAGPVGGAEKGERRYGSPSPSQ